MLRHKSTQSGVTLVEIMIGVAIMGILLAMGASGFSGWIRNSKVRTTAESIQNGLQLARAEAVRRNTLVRFQLTTTAGNDCQINAAGVNWVISLADPTNLCATPPDDVVAPQIIQLRPAAEGSGQASIAAAEAGGGPAVFAGTITFNGLGRVSTATIAGGNNVNIDVSYPVAGTCAAVGGKVRCLRLVVTNGGQVRMCDPKLPTTDPQGC